jgi:aarF domain-containing kinase
MPPRAVVETDRIAPTSTSTENDLNWFYSEVGQKNLAEAMEMSVSSQDIAELLAEMAADYDAARLAEFMASRPARTTGRALTIATSLGGVISGIAADLASGRFESNASRAKQLRDTLASLGPSFVKVGQALSSRPDLLPRTYLEALSSLQDRLESFPSHVAMAVIEEELGRPVDEVYSSISPEPVAAASLGQVYKGTLRSTGEQVAIKVQRPGIGEAIAVDMVLLRRLMGLVDTTQNFVSQEFVPLVDEFACRLFGELDYVQEGRNCEKFRDLYRHVPRVRTPGIKWEATSRRVLTMEWIDGVKLTDKAAMADAGLDVVDFVTVGVECTLRQLLEAGFFHADPHPGNLLATKSGDLVYLDFGMMSEAPSNARYAIIAHIVHLVNRDYLAMCYDYYTLDFMDPEVDTTPIAPALAEFFDEILSDSTVNRLNFKSLVDGLGGVLFQYPFRVPPYYALILRSLTVLEGLALGADPDYNLLGRAYPYVAKRILTDEAPELRSSLEDLILDDGKIRFNRLDNLVREGSKSYDFDADGVWTLVEWVFSDGGRPVRKPLAREMVRIVDAYISNVARAAMTAQLGEDRALRLVPESGEEAASLQRMRTIAGLIGVDLELLRTDKVPGPADVRMLVTGIQQRLTGVDERAGRILQRSSAQEFLMDIQWGLSQHAVARGIKLMNGLFLSSSD